MVYILYDLEKLKFQTSLNVMTLMNEIITFASYTSLPFIFDYQLFHETNYMKHIDRY